MNVVNTSAAVGVGSKRLVETGRCEEGTVCCSWVSLATELTSVWAAADGPLHTLLISEPDDFPAVSAPCLRRDKRLAQRTA